MSSVEYVRRIKVVRTGDKIELYDHSVWLGALLLTEDGIEPHPDWVAYKQRQEAWHERLQELGLGDESTRPLLRVLLYHKVPSYVPPEKVGEYLQSIAKGKVKVNRLGPKGLRDLNLLLGNYDKSLERSLAAD